MPKNVNEVELPQAGEDIAFLGRPLSFSVRSSNPNTPGKAYMVTLFLEVGKVWCSCLSMSWYPCKHIRQAQEYLKTSVPTEEIELPPVQEEELPF